MENHRSRSERNFTLHLENGKIKGNVMLLNNKPSPIPSGGLEIPLQLTFSCLNQWVRDTMKDFIKDFYSYDFTGIIHNDESSDESDFEINVDVEEENEESFIECTETSAEPLQQETVIIIEE